MRARETELDLEPPVAFPWPPGQQPERKQNAAERVESHTHTLIMLSNSDSSQTNKVNTILLG